MARGELADEACEAVPLQAREVDLRRAVADAGRRALVAVDQQADLLRVPGAVVAELQRRARMRWED